MNRLGCLALLAMVILSSPTATQAQSGLLTVQVGTAPLPPTTLVYHTNLWHYRKGTNAPPVDWTTAVDGALDATWNTGRGGIGVADGDDATVLSDMVGRYVTYYIRQTFTVAEPVSPSLRLQLRVDWDDGFVAYLDGVEVARSANVPGTPGTPHPYDQGLTPNPDHPAIVDGGALGVFDLGPVDDRLAAGDHLLAVQGINGDLGSSDTSLAVDLVLIDAAGGSLAEGYFTLVDAPVVQLSGSNTLAGASRLVVNGQDAVFNIAAGTWSRSQALVPGMNRLFIASLDGEGRVLGSLEKDIVYQSASVTAGGALVGSNYWSAASGTVRVSSDLVVRDGASLTVGEGTVVLVSPGVSIRVQTNGSFRVLGTETQPVFLVPGDATNAWGQLSATGTNAVVHLQYAELVAAQMRLVDGGRLTLENCVVRHTFGRQMLEGDHGEQLTLRRVHFHDYAQTHIDFTPTLVEDSLFENITSDAMDFAGNPAEIIVRRTTWRYGFGGNTDAIDLGDNRGLLLEQTLIHDFPDKGISIAENSHGTVVRNCLFYNLGSAISCYASSNCVFEQTTVANSGYGVHLYVRAGFTGAGHAAATNLISWNNTISLEVTNGATLSAAFCDFEGPTLVPGPGNINTDPLFVNPGAGDYRLQAGSPAQGTGLGGLDMGVRFPVGGLAPAPRHLSAVLSNATTARVFWEDNMDNEQGVLLERSVDGVAWTVVGQAPANTTLLTDATLAQDQSYYYRARATNTSGLSRPSNVAWVQTPPAPVAQTIVGGTLANPTTWGPHLGAILVLSDVVVPAGSALTIQAGTQVRLTNNAAVRASGGVINLLGTAQQPISFAPAQGTNNWGELSATGTNSSVTIRHADITRGRIRIQNSATGLLEDAYVHHYFNGATPIIESFAAAQVTMRRCHVEYYHETLFRITFMLIEDCVFENAVDPSSDAVDFDGAPPGSTIRRCTFRNGPQSNTDAVDIGPAPGPISSIGVIIEDCIMHDFTDKGVSIGEESFAITVRNCLIYNVTSGVQVKDISTAIIHDCTIVDSSIGLHGFEKTAGTGGGRLTNTFNNILAYNGAAIAVEPDTVIVATFSDTFGTNWPGLGNINLDPLFLDRAEHDYRLLPNSPCIGTGLGGATMGVTFPVGGLPDSPASLQLLAWAGGQASLAWLDTSDNEQGFLVEQSTDGTVWSTAASIPPNSTATTLSGLNPAQAYLFRVRATNWIGGSFNSGIVSTTGDPNDTDGDGMPNDWELSNGLDPNSAADAAEDDDGDGALNLEEYHAGTDPQNPSSVLKIDSITVTGGQLIQLQFIARAGKAYDVLARYSLTAGDWEVLVQVPAEPETRVYTVSDFLFPGFTGRFYSLRVLP